MRNVYGIGETVLDIIVSKEVVAANPGGSTFNSMISLGRCGAKAAFLTQLGRDRAGRYIMDFMTDNGVDSSYVDLLETRTPLALAFLDEKHDADYTFYRDKPQTQPELRLPDIRPGDLVLFGSFYALNPDDRPRVKAFLEHARSRGAIIYYDINFRPSHLKDLGRCGDALWENIGIADVVRGSHEDFRVLFGIEDVDEVMAGPLKGRCDSLIFTCGSRPLKVRAGALALEYEVKKIPTVSTVGAGDNFNAGFLFGLLREGIIRDQLLAGLSAAQWGRLVATAQSFSASCCQSTENYVTKEFTDSLR